MIGLRMVEAVSRCCSTSREPRQQGPIVRPNRVLSESAKDLVSYLSDGERRNFTNKAGGFMSDDLFRPPVGFPQAFRLKEPIIDAVQALFLRSRE